MSKPTTAKRPHSLQQSSGSVLEGRVRGLGRQGEGAVETSEGIVFVPGALPGEVLRLKVTGRSRGVLRGRLVETIERSNDRVNVVCPHESRCGGCPLMALSADGQRTHKRAMTESALARFSVQGLQVEMTPSPTMTGYRCRARLAFLCNESGRQLGYRREREKRLADIADCAVLDAVCQRGLELTRRCLLLELRGEGELLLGHGANALPVLSLRCQSEQSAQLYRLCESLVSQGEVSGVSLSVIGGAATARFGDPRQCAIAADGKPLWSAAGGFSQSNLAVNRALCAYVLECAEPSGKRLVELFCGHGNFTVLLAKTALNLEAVEADQEAVDACRQNLLARGLEKARVHCASAASFRPKGSVDVVVLDPPRTGARNELPSLISWRPKAVVYVSCDLPTLTRDIAILHQAGYVIERAHAFDMFPHTAHLEVAVRLRRQA